MFHVVADTRFMHKTDENAFGEIISDDGEIVYAKDAPLDPRDDGTQIENHFRINYAGYLQLQDKIAVYLSEESSPRQWELKNAQGETVFNGTSSDRRVNDFASGDTFFLIDFSEFTREGKGYYLIADGNQSSPFSISNDPYGDLKYEFYDYFRDHRRSGDFFNRAVHDWTDHTLTLDFIADSGDQGYYIVNAAEVQWSLTNLLETYPQINEYYSSNAKGMSTVYDELAYFSRPLDKVFFPGQKLAVAKFATLSAASWAPCPGASGDSGGPCVSRPSTKATFAVTRAAAGMARLHEKYGSEEDKLKYYNLAKMAFNNAEKNLMFA